MSEYAEFNDQPEKAEPTDMEKLEAILAKPWRKMTWNERALKATIYGALGAAGAVGAALTYMATHSAGTPSRPGAGWSNDKYQMPVLNPLTPTGPVRPLGFVPMHLGHDGREHYGWY